jgi:pyrimidine operon attenuation protein/uracil phosphoribosyltransferase
MAARFTGGVVDVPADATLVLTRRDDGTLTFSTEARSD